MGGARLRKEGFHAYMVGGAVRDLIVGRHSERFRRGHRRAPAADPQVFRSARIIGRRFRLVHVYCGREKYIEVTTFRSRSAVGTAEHARHLRTQNNLFGTMEEDAERRDFTINALYYCPIDQQVIDYVGGVPDIRQRRLRTLVAAETSFAEDPVRMIRAVKYASLLGFPVPLAMAGLIRRMRESLLTCSRERVTEEVYKILTSGAAAGIFELAHGCVCSRSIFPALAEDLRESRTEVRRSSLWARLRELDRAHARASTSWTGTRCSASFSATSCWDGRTCWTARIPRSSSSSSSAPPPSRFSRRRRTWQSQPNRCSQEGRPHDRLAGRASRVPPGPRAPAATRQRPPGEGGGGSGAGGGDAPAQAHEAGAGAGARGRPSLPPEPKRSTSRPSILLAARRPCPRTSRLSALLREVEVLGGVGVLSRRERVHTERIVDDARIGAELERLHVWSSALA